MYPNPTTDALIGDENQTGKKKRNKERNREWVSNPATLDHSAPSYRNKFIYLLGYNLIPPLHDRRASAPRKETSERSEEKERK